MFTLNVPSKNVANMHINVVINSIGFFPWDPSDLAPTHGPKIATITIALEVAKPKAWSVHPCSLTNQTEKYNPGITKAYTVFAKSKKSHEYRLLFCILFIWDF